MKLSEMLDITQLMDMIGDGYVRCQVHPTIPGLAIYNYSEKAQFERVWNPVTRACRGLIVEHPEGTLDGTVIARPFRKFFNFAENSDPTAVLQPDEPVVVTDKMDGSLGILFEYGGDWHVATRGSFASDQAIHATKLFRERYDYLPMQRQRTVLFEIIFPENRIVLDYGGQDDLVLLGSVDIENGHSYGPVDTVAEIGWKGPVTTVFPYETIGHALAAEPRPNAEGLVVHGLWSDERIKIKQERYVYLHRLITGMNERVVWERIGQGQTLEDLITDIPDEFHPWVSQVADELEQYALDEEAEALRVHQQIVASLPEGFDRRDYARKATQYDGKLRGRLFLLLDGQLDRLHRSIWRDIRPSGAVSMKAISEDVA